MVYERTDYKPAKIAAVPSVVEGLSSSLAGQHLLISDLPTRSSLTHSAVSQQSIAWFLGLKGIEAVNSPDKMTDDRNQNEIEPVDKLVEITNQSNSPSFEGSEQETTAIPTTHISNDSLLSHATQLPTTRKDHVTFWSLPREIRDMIWSEVLGPEDDIFQGNIIASVCDTEAEAKAPAHRTGYLNFGYTQRDDGRFNRVIYAPTLLSSRPPLPLAHLCQELWAFALHRYNAAYRKVTLTDPNLLKQVKGDRFRWLFRSNARIVRFIYEGDYDDSDIQDIKRMPLGEKEPVILICHGTNWYPWALVDHQLDDRKRGLLVELLKQAKDYQIFIYDPPAHRDRYVIDPSVAKKWGVFADRAPGEGWPEERQTKSDTQTFVEARDVPSMVQLLRKINDHNDGSGGFQRLEEKELFPCGNALDDLENRQYEEWVERRLSTILEAFEKLWAQANGCDVDEREISATPPQSQLRHRRMPKIGHVLKLDVTLTLKELDELYPSSSGRESG